MIFQSTIAILLLVGFESITSLGSEAINPKKDIRNAILLALVIQGAFAYLLEYFAANYFVGPQLVSTSAGVTVTGYAQSAASGAPIGDMIRIIGDQMLGGNGFVLVLIMAATVVLALIGTTLACLNTAVRVTYAMGKDKEMPSVMGLLHGRFATPHWNIWILVAVSAIFGAYGVLSVDNMTQITWASNIGTFMLYGLTNLIALWAFLGRPNSSIIKHKLVPIAGFLANLLMLVAVLYIGASAGGSSATDAIIALAMVVVWMVVGIVWFIINTRKQGHKILIKGAEQLTHEDLRENIT
jgi:amino acid transporter